MPSIQLPGVRLHYESAGSGPTDVLLIHGNSGSGRWWQPFLEAVPEGLRAFAPDLRGGGGSERPRTGHSVEQMARDMADFISALLTPPVPVVGHSLGGVIALQLALDRPDLVASLLLVAPGPAEGMERLRLSPRGKELVAPKGGAALWLLRQWYIVAQRIGWLRKYYKREFTRRIPAVTRLPGFEAIVADAAEMAVDAFIGRIRALHAWRALERLGEVRAPVTILIGGADRLITREVLEPTIAALADVRVEEWPHCGHAPTLDQPDRFARLVRELVIRT